MSFVTESSSSPKTPSSPTEPRYKNARRPGASGVKNPRRARGAGGQAPLKSRLVSDSPASSAALLLHGQGPMLPLDPVDQKAILRLLRGIDALTRGASGALTFTDR